MISINLNHITLSEVFQSLVGKFILENFESKTKIYSYRFEIDDLNKDIISDINDFITNNAFLEIGQNIDDNWSKNLTPKIIKDNIFDGHSILHFDDIIEESFLENKHNFYASNDNNSYFGLSIEAKYCELRLTTIHKYLIDQLNEIKNKWSSKKSFNHLNLLISTQNGFKLRPLGKTDWPDLIEDNYHEKVIEEVKFILDDLNNPEPLGRLNLICGPAGCGKSHIIKHILKSATKGKLILIQSDEFNKIGSSEVLNYFSNIHEENEPLILIIEDADQCLVKRQDNQSNISALLNLTDGILGHMLDMRVIATSNAKHLDMDSALLRPGRLNKKVEVDFLKPSHADKVYNRIRKEHNLKLSSGMDYYTEPKSLAQIYADALDHKNNERQSKNIGFGI